MSIFVVRVLLKVTTTLMLGDMNTTAIGTDMAS
jgi:hypothetical protein